MQMKEYLQLPYTITLRPDDEGDWVARIEELEGCVAHGATQAEALARLEEAKTLWIEAALDDGQPIPEPAQVETLPSGRWVQRVPRSLHRRLVQLARKEGTSLNQLVTSMLAECVGSANAAHRTTTQPIVVVHRMQASTGGSSQNLRSVVEDALAATSKAPNRVH